MVNEIFGKTIFENMAFETVYAIHSFEAENEDEIPFQVGEPIIILEKDELYGDSWWKGKNIHGQTGLFPMTYISYERPPPINPMILPLPSINDSTKENFQSQASDLNMYHASDLDYRMPSPSIDETIDDIQNKLHRMTIRNEEEQFYKHRFNRQNHHNNNTWSQKNVHPSSKLFMASSSGSSTSSRMSSTGKQLSSPHSPFELLDTTRKSEIPSSPSTTVNGRQPISHPVTWDVDQVCIWLSEKGFESEIDHFIDNDITGDVLVGLNISTLSEELNITSYGKRVRIMNAIKELKAQFISENDDISDLEEYHNAQPIYPNSLYSNQTMDSSVTLQQYGITSSLSLPQISEVPGHLVSSPRTSVPNLSKNYPPTYYTYSQRVDDAEGANIETIPRYNKKDKILAKLNLKRNTDMPLKKKDKFRTSSAGGWDFSKDEEIRELIKYKKIKNRSLEVDCYVSVPEKGRSLNFIPKKKKKPILDRSSFVGSRLGLPKQSMDGDTTVYFENGDFDENTIISPDYAGWLKKQGDKYKTWKTRYCVLKGANFYYFKNDKEMRQSDVKGYINLTGFRIITDENILHGKYGFKLIHDYERSHYFAHEDRERIKGWMKAMMKATIERDVKAPVVSSSNIATVPLSEARKLTPRPPEPRRPSVSTAALNKVTSPILGPISPLLQRTGSPSPFIPSRPLSPALHNSSSPLMRPLNSNSRSAMGYI